MSIHGFQPLRRGVIGILGVVGPGVRPLRSAGLSMVANRLVQHPLKAPNSDVPKSHKIPVASWFALLDGGPNPLAELPAMTPVQQERVAQVLAADPKICAGAILEIRRGDEQVAPDTVRAILAMVTMRPRVFAQLAQETAKQERVDPTASHVSSPALCSAASGMMAMAQFNATPSVLELKLAMAIPNWVGADLRGAPILGMFGRTLNLGRSPPNLLPAPEVEQFYLKLPKVGAKPDELRFELQAMTAFGDILRGLGVPTPVPVGLLSRERWPEGARPDNLDPEAQVALLYRAPAAYNEYIHQARTADEAAAAAVKYARFVGHLAARGFLPEPDGAYFHNETDGRSFVALLAASQGNEVGRVHDVWKPTHTPNIGRGGPRDLKHYAHMMGASDSGVEVSAKACGDALFYGYLNFARWFKEHQSFANHRAFARGMREMTHGFVEEFVEAPVGSKERAAMRQCIDSFDWDLVARQSGLFLSGDYAALFKTASAEDMKAFYDKRTAVRFAADPGFVAWEREAGRADLGGFNQQNPLTAMLRVINLTVPGAFLWRGQVRAGVEG